MLRERHDQGECLSAPTPDPFRVMIVDDSIIVRKMVDGWLAKEPGIAVVATLSNGRHAVERFAEFKPDIVVLDIEMPEMDGLTALPKLLAADPRLIVIMASTLTLRNAQVSLKALSLGAADYVPKPSTAHGLISTNQFRDELIAKINALGATRRTNARARLRQEAPPHDATPGRPGRSHMGKSPRSVCADLHRSIKPGAKDQIELRPASARKPDFLAIGSSTGGPQALLELFKHLPRTLSIPVAVTQHMPPMFTAILADHLAKATGFEVREGAEGDVVRPNCVYIAPGNYHMTFAKGANGVSIALNQDEPENFCRPSVDPMLRSLAGIYGDRILSVILTGMGHDGLAGAQAVVERGGTILAQDEASSVVWGMPKAVALGGLCAGVYPLTKIPMVIEKYVQGGRL